MAYHGSTKYSNHLAPSKCGEENLISFTIGPTMEEGYVDALANSIREKLPQLKSKTSSVVTIPRVPERLRLGEKDAYEPRIISFGPYYHGEPRLQAMEKYKWSFLEAILYCNQEISLECYINVIKEKEEETRCCYSDHFKEMDSKEFVEMMLIDGCFIVGYLLQIHSGVFRELGNIVWMHPLIRYDILLLENQLPFSILIKIFELLTFTPSLAMDSHACQSLLTVIAISYLTKITEENADFPPPESVHHLLHLYHLLCLYTPESEAASTTRHVPIVGRLHQPPSATVLHEAGIKFKSKEVEGSSSLDVTFSKAKGKMMIPPLVIDSFNKSRLRNLIAFEQFYPNFNELDKSFTAYVEFMDFIVNTPEDVALLYKKGIICHFLGSDKIVADFFNDLIRGTFVKSNHYLSHLYGEVHEYQQNRRHKWHASLMHNYFNSPWAVLGIVAGAVLLVLTLLQTYFSGLSAF